MTEWKTSMKEAGYGLAVIVLAPLWIPVFLVVWAFEGLRLLGHGFLQGWKDANDKQGRVVMIRVIRDEMSEGPVFWEVAKDKDYVHGNRILKVSDELWARYLAVDKALDLVLEDLDREAVEVVLDRLGEL